MARVFIKHVLDWHRQHPGGHRTMQQGREITCQDAHNIVHAVPIERKAKSIRHCPFCRRPLPDPQPIPNERQEFQWLAVA